jgi:hypothetical protein
MQNAIFIVREGMPAGALMTVHGPFVDEATALVVAATLQPGKYTIYSNASPGKSFSIAPPIVSFDL